MLTLRQLRYLDALTRQRHFGRAAEECAVSQPALSMQIRELEDFLGGELIERRQGDALPTERGLQIAKRAASVLSAVRELVEFAHSSARPLYGPLRLGIIPTLAPYILPKVVPTLRDEYPDLNLSLVESPTKTLVSDLARGHVELGLLSLPLAGTDFESLQLFEDRFLLAVPEADPLPERARVTKQDVEQRNLLLLEEGHCLREQALSYCAQQNNLNKEFFGTSLTTIMQMVASGYGVTLLPEMAVDTELRDDRVKLLRFSDPQPRRQIGLIWRPTSPRKADYREFGRLVVEMLSRKLSIKPDSDRGLNPAAKAMCHRQIRAADVPRRRPGRRLS